MATVVSIMDRPGWDARTDNIAIVDPAAERVLWIPRDLWCDGISDRINEAFALGGHDGLVDALAEHGFVVQHSLCLARAAVEAALDAVVVRVPVAEDQSFWYPLEPLSLVQDGRKLVSFRAPAETLSGERVHQWLGARHGVGRPSDDFDRIGRQQTLLRSLWADGFDFGRVVANPEWVSMSSDAACDELRAARETWRFETFTDVIPRTIAGHAVLVDRRRVPRLRLLRWRLEPYLEAGWRRLPIARRASS